MRQVTSFKVLSDTFSWNAVVVNNWYICLISVRVDLYLPTSCFLAVIFVSDSCFSLFITILNKLLLKCAFSGCISQPRYHVKSWVNSHNSQPDEWIFKEFQSKDIWNIAKAGKNIMVEIYIYNNYRSNFKINPVVEKVQFAFMVDSW